MRSCPIEARKTIARSSEAANGMTSPYGRLPNTWQIDWHFVRFDAACCAFDELPIFIGKSLFQSDWVGRNSNPESTPLQVACQLFTKER